MDKTVVANLINTYLDSIKILVSDDWPHDIPEVLDDLIQETTKVAEEMKRQRLKWKSERKLITNTEDRKLIPKNYNPHITPKNGTKLFQHKNKETKDDEKIFKEMKIIERTEESGVEPQQKVLKLSEDNLKIIDSKFEEDKVDKENCKNIVSLNDGCVFQ